MITYSQFGIEKYLDALFQGPGFFVELGAWDGKNISNSLYLENKGWRGLCVDPFPQNFQGRRAQVCSKAISGAGGVRDFIRVTTDRRHNGDVSYFSGFLDTIGRHEITIRKFCNYKIVTVETITFDQLVNEYGLPEVIDFLSIDTEGSEEEIIQSIDFNKYKFRALLYEHNQDQGTRRRVGKILESNGYRLYQALDFDDLYIFDHKKWLDGEYKNWIQALNESTVHNFKDHPMGARMLGEIDPAQYVDLIESPGSVINVIDNIGRAGVPYLSGVAMRMIYYARKVLERAPRWIVEIGGGVGQFYATLRALGYEGNYFIMDLTEVRDFQQRYLAEVEKRIGLKLPLSPGRVGVDYDFCVSFYALGEFDDELKNYYIEHIIKKCPHGLIVWNPHSGASSEINFECTIEDEFPTTHPENKVLTW